MNNKINLEEGDICDWINAYLHDEIDAEVFANLVIFYHLCSLDISDPIKGTILVVMGNMVSKKPFTQQDRKKVKEQLKKIVEIYNQSNKSKE